MEFSLETSTVFCRLPEQLLTCNAEVKLAWVAVLLPDRQRAPPRRFPRFAASPWPRVSVKITGPANVPASILASTRPGSPRPSPRPSCGELSNEAQARVPILAPSTNRAHFETRRPPPPAVCPAGRRHARPSDQRCPEVVRATGSCWPGSAHSPSGAESKPAMCADPGHGGGP